MTLAVSHHPSRLALPRIVAAVWRQSARTLGPCPDRPRLDGQLAVVTGANGGIGLATAAGLLARGAEVVLACRNPERLQAATERLAAAQPDDTARIHALSLDLSDLNKVAAACDVLKGQLGGRKIDVLVANAGLWPLSYGESAQGHEIAFAVNLLGHHLLVRRLLDDGRLTGRLVWVTGDIYILATACTPDYRYRGAWGGQLAYARSKLGLLWIASQLRERYRTLDVYAVHPGVVDTDLLHTDAPWISAVRRRLFIDPERGAQTSLLCTTQPVPPGYYHNTMGRMELHPRDPGRDDASARALWRTCERLCEPWLDR